MWFPPLEQTDLYQPDRSRSSSRSTFDVSPSWFPSLNALSEPAETESEEGDPESTPDSDEVEEDGEEDEDRNGGYFPDLFDIPDYVVPGPGSPGTPPGYIPPSCNIPRMVQECESFWISQNRGYACASGIRCRYAYPCVMEPSCAVKVKKNKLELKLFKFTHILGIPGT